MSIVAEVLQSTGKLNKSLNGLFSVYSCAIPHLTKLESHPLYSVGTAFYIAVLTILVFGYYKY